VAIVTGDGSDIGRASCLRLAEEGARVDVLVNPERHVGVLIVVARPQEQLDLLLRHVPYLLQISEEKGSRRADSNRRPAHYE
jgi:NAD(P)-dependent dehydrogenase (short-subunit alcohol dehydrogenase family)